MKTMKIWRLAFAMLAAFSLASCHSSASKEAGEVGLTADSAEQTMYQTYAEAHRLDSIGEHAAAFLLREHTLAAYCPNTMECLQYKGIRCSLENKADSANIYFAQCEKMCDNVIRESLDINAITIKAFILVYTGMENDARDFLQQLRRQHPHETRLEQLYQDFDVIKEAVSISQGLRISQNTLRLVIRGEDSAASDSAEPVRLKLPLDSIVIEMVNNTDITCVTGEWYNIEHRVNGKWETLPIKPRNDGLIYGFDDIGHELAGHASRHFTIHIQPDMYDFEHGREYRIGKEYHVSGEKRPRIAYCYFKTE